jgi:DNA-binding MarR family transcriptional regulator
MKSDKGMNLWVHLDQVNTLVRKARALELKHYNFTLAEAEILYILIRENKDLTLAEIAWWNCRELNSVLIRVNKMEKKGLVKKIRGSGGKKSKVHISEKGRELYSKVTSKSIHMIFDVISEEEKENLESILQKLDVRTRELLGIGFKPPFLP